MATTTWPARRSAALSLRSFPTDAPELTYEITDLRPAGGGYDFSLELGGRSRRFHSPLAGPYNVWNLTAGIILAHELGPGGSGRDQSAGHLRRRGAPAVVPRGSCRTRCFSRISPTIPRPSPRCWAACPTPIPGRKIVVVFEPRSWSLRRNFFQGRLPASLGKADEIVIKDVYEKEKIPAGERLDVGALQAELQAMGKTVHVFADFAGIKSFIGAMDFSREQVVILLSNGDVRDFTDWVKGLAGISQP